MSQFNILALHYPIGYKSASRFLQEYTVEHFQWDGLSNLIGYKFKKMILKPKKTSPYFIK